ncbi:uncharacterized protein LOC119347273 [Triticum dicoccoides]|uniref:uncharacterized protein LOC119292949 n=1 Tax=Triticum dicoccoides TaxID=85692 RepID=UPI00188F975A|nr:uncharacterized protein LOC119292949 [Triticum dicoccoides]XP_037472016.1 uncharacterized protein LOC119347273 [Triticum dicoccoides]
MSGERKQLELHTRLTKTVVEINGDCPDPTPEDENKRKYFPMIGTIVVAAPDFCFVVVKSSLIEKHGIYTINRDGKSINIKAEDFILSIGTLAGFYLYHNQLPYDIEKVEAVEFGEEVELFDVVYLCDLTFGLTKLSFDLTDGHVMDTDGVNFVHNCAQSLHTGQGAPVFSGKGKLVGLCILNIQGPSIALTVTQIKQNLMRIYKTKTLEKFFEEVRASAGNAKAPASAMDVD